MYKIACDYLCIPTLTVPSEEANSEAKSNFQDRSRLHSCTFRAERCIKSWLDLLEEENILLPKDFNDAYDSLDFELGIWGSAMEDNVVEYMLKCKI